MILPDESATRKLGARLAAVLRPGDVIGLFGDLGAGKTSFARGLLTGLGLDEEAPSPSFAIVQPYDAPDVRVPVWHVDLYRIEDTAEVRELGLDEAREEAALVIEWPERLGEGLWPDTLRLHFEVQHAGPRRLTADVPQAWEGRWPPPDPR